MADQVQAMQQMMEALQALYSAPDPTIKKQANDWLVQFQQTPQAWQVADQLLQRPETPPDYRVFAAQTMRSKVQFDFDELPVESYGGLRDSLLGHVERFQGSAPDHATHTALSVTIADLAIQMDAAWPNAVGDLFTRWSQSAENYPTLLEVLRVLPEENMNKKLMTDSTKRASSRQRLKTATRDVLQFLLQLQCPTPQAKRKVLECFLSWVKFDSLDAETLVQNASQLLTECCQFIIKGGDMSEPATDIVVEILRMAGEDDVQGYMPVVKLLLEQLAPLRQKLDALLARGKQAAVDSDLDSCLQICRVYTELGETLVPVMKEQSNSPEVTGILQTILLCTDLPNSEIGSVPLEFWQRLSYEVGRHPERDVHVNHFQPYFLELLSIASRHAKMPDDEDPFHADHDFVAYRTQLWNMIGDCAHILTPNTAMEHLLKNLSGAQAEGIQAQEAHFYCLTKIGDYTEVREDSVLWQLIQSLPPLISQPVPDNTQQAIFLNFLKKTAIELLGCLARWVHTRPDLLRVSLEMISTLLLTQCPAGSDDNVQERVRQVQEAASKAFRQICDTNPGALQELMPQLSQLYMQTMNLPIRTHLCLVDGMAQIIKHTYSDELFCSMMEKLIMPLVQGLNSEREKPQVLCEILDRMTMIIRNVEVNRGTEKAEKVGTLISNAFWPLIRQTLSTHPGDPKVVEKSCRLLKHSMRCVPDQFKVNVQGVAQLLMTSFQQHQHSSYLYIPQILADTYSKEPEIVPMLAELFNGLSATAIQVLNANVACLEHHTELVEDFYGLFERYMRFVPDIVVQAPTLMPMMQLWPAVIFVQQKEALEAIIALMEIILAACLADSAGPMTFRDESAAVRAQALRPTVVQVCPAFTDALFRLMAGVPTKYAQMSIPSLIHHLRRAFPQEFPAWLEAAFRHLPPSAVSQAERQHLGEQIVRGRTESDCTSVIDDLCYRCEQVALRSSGGKK
eukprot:TRINITY_DN91410_c0_g1_i1.p1 TRINITY_DN91410_c0_g1~~TRINITY_DN91410_c0_g1_i1.p1  ORF type:complete len:963 (+),score=250.38 TRINITY_DN91410_c0_g1_i1:149-3037(+)